jgi:regulatory protein
VTHRRRRESAAQRNGPAAGIVTGLHVQRRNPERVNLHIDGEFCCGVAYDVAHSERLRVGAPVSAPVLERIRAADEQWRAKQAALSLLATRARARRELADRLRRKQFGASAIEAALAEVERLGLIDDRAFAESWVRDRLRFRPRGSRALVAELGRKGVDSEIARAAVARVMDAARADDAGLCLNAAEKWVRRHGRPADAADRDQRLRSRRRLSAFLQRRGYGADQIRAALSAHDVQQ